MLDTIAQFLSGKYFLVYLVVFLGKLTEVTLASLRSQLIVKGQRYIGALIAMFEYLIWIIITANVLTGFAEDPLRLVLLTAAFALGQVLGSILEERLALGNVMISTVFMNSDKALIAESMLREKGFSMTRFEARGMDCSQRVVLNLTVKRKNINCVKRMIKDADSSAVLSMTPSVQMDGGTMMDKVKPYK
ncbi:MAG: DUF5698 domain-containing protein [Sphaerochaetaceae bacterium]|jgi:uncharacterized protein YebE (UPF0316 family)|nr:DUF5698 domain-containing protein [Sphaerochaetaceae bacterium]